MITTTNKSKTPCQIAAAKFKSDADCDGGSTNVKSSHQGPTTIKAANLLHRKRKRSEEEDDLEGTCLHRRAREEIKADKQHANATKRFKPKKSVQASKDRMNLEDMDNDSEAMEMPESDEEHPKQGPPQNKSRSRRPRNSDLDKPSRTVFLANVSTMAIKSKKARKILIDHLVSFVSWLPERDFSHGVESLRFRSTAFAARKIPRKAAFAMKDLMDTTTKSTHAYVVYTTQLAAREAVSRLNGSTVLDRHIRVDSVAHPSKIDSRRCVFVGNLDFVDDEPGINSAANEETSKRSRTVNEPADVEEGLWRQFGKAGIVESVRVIRDKTTQIGKGFAYVQFKVFGTQAWW